MIELFEQELKSFERHSSKGNQLKWKCDNIWYKADYAGYESLAEYVVSGLLKKSSLKSEEYVRYGLDQAKYKRNMFNASSSTHFLEEDWQIITLERLYKNYCNRSLYNSVWSIEDVTSRFCFLVGEIRKITGIQDFDKYLATLFTLDAMFLNEDRHFHNIAVLMNGSGEYRLCPIFDNGASLLSDITIDYPMGTDVMELIPEVKAKSISRDFDEQLNIAEKVCGSTLSFSFAPKDVDKLLEDAGYFYDEKTIERVRLIMYQQIRKYKYLFH